MSRLFRRTDLAENRELLTISQRRHIQQQVRDAGDGVPAHASAKWGGITGAIADQTDLKEVTDNNEALAVLADDGS